MMVKWEGFLAFEVALQCGYGEACYFSREFLKLVRIEFGQYVNQ